MPEIRLFEGSEPTVVTPPVRTIRPGKDRYSPQAAKPEGDGYVCRWANEQANSRTRFSFPTAELQVKWIKALPESLRPAFVLQGNDRILLYGNEWLLADPAGTFAGSGAFVGVSALLDPRHGLWYRTLGSGHFGAFRTSEGSLAFTYLPSGGDKYGRSMITRKGNRVLIGGSEVAVRPLDTGPPPPRQSVLEALDIPEPLQTSEMGTLLTESPERTLYFPTPDLFFAATKDFVVAAGQGRIYITDWDLRVHRVLEGSFDPLFLSLDEGGRIYMVSRQANRGHALWLITQEGDLIYSFDLLQGLTSPQMPPIIAPDHTAYLIAGNHILAIAPDGKLNWSRPAAGPVGGAIVMPDGRLSVSEADTVAVWDAQGRRTVLFRSGGENFRTAPVPTASGDVVVASEKRLFYLTARTP